MHISELNLVYLCFYIEIWKVYVFDPMYVVHQGKNLNSTLHGVLESYFVLRTDTKGPRTLAFLQDLFTEWREVTLKHCVMSQI